MYFDVYNFHQLLQSTENKTQWGDTSFDKFHYQSAERTLLQCLSLKVQ